MIWLEIAWINKTHWERVRFLIGCENKQMRILTTRLQPISTSNHSETVETVLGWDSSIAVTSHILGFFQGRMGDFFNHLKTWCPLWSSSQTWLNIKTISNQPKNYVLRKIHHLQNLQLEILQCNVWWPKASWVIGLKSHQLKDWHHQQASSATLLLLTKMFYVFPPWWPPIGKSTHTQTNEWYM